MGYTTEIWAEYGIGMAFLFLRFFARIKVVGLSGLAWDDFFAFISMILWTVDAVTVQIINDYGSFVGLNEHTADVLSDETVARFKIGSKALFVAWLSYVSLIWSLKASLLFFYSRLTLGLRQQKLVRVMACASVVGYVAVILTLFGHCTPIQKNWQIKPYAGDKCTLTVASYIVVAALNVVTDAGILSIPVPLIWKVKIPLRRKLVIGLLLSSGIFVITAALLRCVLSLANANQIGNSTIWGIRETFVSLIAISAPVIKPLFNKNQWMASSSNGASTQRFQKFGDNKISGVKTSQSTRDNMGQDLEGGNLRNDSESLQSDIELRNTSRNGSQEYIIDAGKNAPLEINVTTAYALKDDEDAETLSSPRTAEHEASDPFRSESALSARRARWGSTTQITVGERRDSARAANKSARILGMGTSP